MFFYHKLHLLEKSSLKTCYSPSNSSLLIIAREEYESLQMSPPFFSPFKLANRQLRVTISFENCLIIRKTCWVKYCAWDNWLDYLT